LYHLTKTVTSLRSCVYI